MNRFTDLSCKLSKFRLSAEEQASGHAAHPPKTNEQVFQIVSVAESIPERLFSTATLDEGSSRVDLDLRKMAAAPRMLASRLNSMSVKDLSESSLENMMRDTIKADRRIAGMCVAFEPSKFREETENFALYVSRDLRDRSAIKSMQLTPPNYVPLYREWDWYALAKNRGEACWTEPYLDEGGGNVPMLSYSVPIVQGGAFVGIVSMDVELNNDSSKPMTRTATEDAEGADADAGSDEDASAKLAEIAGAPRLIASKLESFSDELTETVIRDMLSEMLMSDAYVYATSIAFEPYAYDKDTDAFSVFARRERFSSDIVFKTSSEPLYGEPWYARAKETGEGGWTEPYNVDIESGQYVEALSLVTFSIPFKKRLSPKDGLAQHTASVSGVVRVDVKADELFSLHSSLPARSRVITCASSKMPTDQVYYRDRIALAKRHVSLQAFADGVLPSGATPSDFECVRSSDYVSFLETYRRPADIVFGQLIQLVHTKSGRFLNVSLLSAASARETDNGTRRYYSVQLEDNTEPDPYLEGSPSTWFQVLPSSDIRSLGEKVQEGDQVRLVSARWQWDLHFPSKNAAAAEEEVLGSVRRASGRSVQEDKERKLSTANMQLQYGAGRKSENTAFGSVLNWKLVPYGTSDRQLRTIVGGESESSSARAADAFSAKDNENVAVGLSTLEPPTFRSPYLRDGDLIRLRSSTSGEILVVSSAFTSYAEEKRVRRAMRDLNCKYVHSGRFHYTAEVAADDPSNQDRDGDDEDLLEDCSKLLHGVWKVEVSGAGDSEDPVSNVVTWDSHIRFRHVLSHRHLCVDALNGLFEGGFAPDSEDDDLVFVESESEDNTRRTVSFAPQPAEPEPVQEEPEVVVADDSEFDLDSFAAVSRGRSTAVGRGAVEAPPDDEDETSATAPVTEVRDDVEIDLAVQSGSARHRSVAVEEEAGQPAARTRTRTRGSTATAPAAIRARGRSASTRSEIEDDIPLFEYLSPQQSYPVRTIELNDLNEEQMELVYVDFQFNPMRPEQAEESVLVTTKDGFFISLVTQKQRYEAKRRAKAQAAGQPPPPPLGGVVEEKFWLNLAGEGACFTSYKDEEDSFNSLKITMAEQKAIYTVRSSLKSFDAFIDKLFSDFPRYVPESDELLAEARSNADATDVHQQLYSFEQYTVSHASDFARMHSLLSHMCRFVIASGANPDMDIKALVSDPIHEKLEPTGMTVQWRQDMLLSEGVITRIFALLQHPLFAGLVLFPSSKTKLSQGDSEGKSAAPDAEEEHHEAETSGATPGLLRPTSVSRRLRADSVLGQQELAEDRDKLRENALNVYRQASILLCVMMIDFPSAAVAAAQGDRLDFLVSQVAPSAFHRLGTQRVLALLFENGRRRLSSLSLSEEHLSTLLPMWTRLVHLRLLERERAARSNFGDVTVRREVMTRYTALCRSSHNFLRILKALTVSRGAPDYINQKQLLDALVAEAERARGATQVDFGQLPSADSVTEEERAANLAQLPTAVERSLLGLVVCLSRGAAHAPFSISPSADSVALVLGLDELDLSFRGLLRATENAELDFAMRSQYAVLLHELYVTQPYPRRLVNLTPYFPAREQGPPLSLLGVASAQRTDIVEEGDDLDAELSADSDEEDDGKEDAEAEDVVVVMPAAQTSRPRTFSEPVVKPKQMSAPDALVVWQFALNYLSQCATHSDRNVLTINVLQLTHSLIRYDFDESSEDPEVALQARGQRRSSIMDMSEEANLSQLGTILISILKSQQVMQSDNPVPAAEWAKRQAALREIKIIVCEILNTMFDFRLDDYLRTFLTLRDTDRFVNGDWAAPYVPELGSLALGMDDADPLAMAPVPQGPDDVPLLSVDSSSKISMEVSDGEDMPPLNRTKSMFQRMLESSDDEEAARPKLPSVEELVLGKADSIFSTDVQLDRVLLNIIENVVDDGELVTSAFALLQRQHKQAFEVVKAASQAVVLGSVDDMRQSHRVELIVRDLNELLRPELGLDRATDFNEQRYTGKMERVNTLLQQLVAEALHKNSDELDDESSMTGFSRSHSDVAIPGLTTLNPADSAHASDGAEGATAPELQFRVTQEIFRILDVNDIAVAVLQIPLAPSNEMLKTTFRLCYSVLINFADGNTKNMKKLEPFVDLFFSQAFLGPGPTVLLTKLMTDNYELCSRIKPEVLQDYLDFLALSPLKLPDTKHPVYGGAAWTRTAVPLQFLKAIVRVDTQLVKQNQIQVVKSICEKVNLLGYFAELENRNNFRQLIELLSFKVSEDDDLVDVDADERRRRRLLLQGKQFYLELISLLTRCAPCKYVYVNERAMRESEESAMLCKAALPIRPLAALICMVKDSAARIPLVRFLEQVYGGNVEEVPKRVTARLLSSFAESMNQVSAQFQHEEEREVNAATMTAAERAEVEVQPPHSSAWDISYTLDVVLSFLIGYYHSTFRLDTASEAEIDASNMLFDSIVSMARRSLDCNFGQKPLATPQHRDTVARRVSFSAVESARNALRDGFGLENMLNCLIHMHDPNGKQCYTGVRGALSEEEFRKLVGDLQVAIMLVNNLHEEEAKAKKQPKAAKAAAPMARGPRKRRGTIFGKSPTASYKTARKWVKKMKPSLSRARGVENARLSRLVVHHSQSDLLEKIILLIGEFAMDEDPQRVNKHGSKNEWINDNSSKFCVGYMEVLQYLVDNEETLLGAAGGLSIRERMVNLSLPQILISLVSRTASVKITKGAFALANSLLEGGFGPAQLAFLRTLAGPSAESAFFARLREQLTTKLKITTRMEQARGASSGSKERYGSWPLQTSVLRFLQLLCEGHNLAWQRMLNNQALGRMTLVQMEREEADGQAVEVDLDDVPGVSVNLVSYSVDLFSYLAYQYGPLWYVLVYWDRWFEPEVITHVVDTSVQLVNTLIEVMQGPCSENQVELSRGRFVETVNWVLDALVMAESQRLKHEGLVRMAEQERQQRLELGEEVGPVEEIESTYGVWDAVVLEAKPGQDDAGELDRREVFLELQQTLIVSLNSMLEGHVEATVPRKIMAVMRFGAIEKLMQVYLQTAKDNVARTGSRLYDDKYAQLLADYYIFIITLITRHESANLQTEYSASFAHLLNSATFIECEQRFGRMVGSVEILRDDRLEVMLFRIPELVLSQSKTPGFEDMKNDVVYSVRRENQHAKVDDFLQASDELIYELTSYPELKQSRLVRGLPFFTDVTFFLAVLLNLFSVISDDNDDWWVSELFGSVLILMSFVRFLSFLGTVGPLALYRYKKQLESADSGGGPLQSLPNLQTLLTLGIVKTSLDGEDEEVEEVEEEEVKEEDVASDGMRELTRVEWVGFVTSFLFSPISLFQLIYVICVGLAFWEPVFYAYCLLDIVPRSPLLRQVLGALRAYLPSLGATGALWLVLMYIWAAVGFAYFSEDFGLDRCDSKVQCVSLVFSEGLPAGGGVADIMEENKWGDGDYFPRAVYNITFFVFIPILMLSIVSAVVIDSFGSSRDHRHDVAVDQRGMCFICGIESSRFETRKGFAWHVEHEHNMWQYVYLLAALRTKEETEYNGQESYVAECAKAASIEFFPIERSLMLEEEE